MREQRMIGDRSPSEIVRVIQDFIVAYDQNSLEDQAIASRLREQLYSEFYRRERSKYPEWVDLGGEGGAG